MGDSADKNHVFISYGRRDRDRVQVIADVLGEAGIKVWWDADLRPGTNFRAETAKALKTGRAVIVVWSEHSVDRTFVLDEASHALERGVLFPVMIDSIEIPLGFRQIQTVDLSNWGGEKTSKNLSVLVEAIAEAIAASRVEPEPEPEPKPAPEPRASKKNDNSFAPLIKKMRTSVGSQKMRFASSIAVSVILAIGSISYFYSTFEGENRSTLSLTLAFLVLTIPLMVGRFYLHLGDRISGRNETKVFSRQMLKVFAVSFVAGGIIGVAVFGDIIRSRPDGVVLPLFFLFAGATFGSIGMFLLSAIVLMWTVAKKIISR